MTDELERKRFSKNGDDDNDDDDDDDEASYGRIEFLPLELELALELLCLLPNQAEQVEELNNTSNTNNPHFPVFIIEFEFIQPCNDEETRL